LQPPRDLIHRFTTSHNSAVLTGNYVRLEPLDHSHASELLTAATIDRSLYQFSLVPGTGAEVSAYIETALTWEDMGTALPFAIVRIADNAIVGSTRLFKLERWAWPAGHPRNGNKFPDVGEIGYSWLTSSAIRTPINTEAKLLLLAHAFDALQMLRVSLHTDVRNLRSRAAIERIGGKFEGILRSHRLSADNIARDSARFSIVAAEWPEAKRRLTALLDR
jgi:N-acetyltransferase